MKKRWWLISLIIIFLTMGCMGMASSPSSKVEELLRRYQNHSEGVIIELGDFLDSLNLDPETRDDYHSIYLRQYQDMEFEIKNETIDGDRAVVTVAIKVYDYYRAEININNFIMNNPNEFMDDDGNFSPYLAFRHRIDELLRVNDRVEYNVDFTITLINDEWVIDTLTEEQLEKIHGTFAY